MQSFYKLGKSPIVVHGTEIVSLTKHVKGCALTIDQAMSTIPHQQTAHPVYADHNPRPGYHQKNMILVSATQNASNTTKAKIRLNEFHCQLLI
jgi:hypothetical protein